MKDIDKNKIKHTIGYKMTVIIVAIMGLSLIAASIFSSFFLSKYYKKTKQDSIKKVYNEFIKIIQDDENLKDSDNISTLNNICEKAGATMIVVDSAGDSVYDYGAGKMLADRWRDMIFGSNIKQKEEPRVIEKNDKYTIQSTVDRFSANQYYELSGGLASGNYVVIRMSVESFRESIAIANKFYLGVGISLILVTTLIIIWITRKYTQPLLQLADISKRMSELDFNVKYEDDRDDEIGVLGESMNEMSDKLETAISELKSANLQLHKDIAKKEEVDEMRKEFISNVSHELKTPLMSIHIMLENMILNIGKYKNHDVYLPKCQEAVVNLSSMVQEILDTSRLNSLNGETELKEVDLKILIESIIEPYKIIAKSKKINMNIDYSNSLNINTDKSMLKKALSNIISNAVNYTDNGKNINIYFEKNSLIIENECKPIEQNHLDHIFEAFYRAEFDRNKNTGGNGLGLYIVQQILKTLNISHSFESVQNGMKFTINFEENNLIC